MDLLDGSCHEVINKPQDALPQSWMSNSVKYFTRHSPDQEPGHRLGTSGNPSAIVTDGLATTTVTRIISCRHEFVGDERQSRMLS